MTIEEYMLKMKNVAESLLVAGQTIIDDELIQYILGGLGQEYESVVVNLTCRQDNITIQEVQYILQTQEMHLESLLVLLQLKLIILKSRQPASNELVMMEEIRIIMVVHRTTKKVEVEVVMAEEMVMVVVEIGMFVNFVVGLVMLLLNAITDLIAVSMENLMETMVIRKVKLIKLIWLHQTQSQIQLGIWTVVRPIMLQLMLTIRPQGLTTKGKTN